MEQRYSSRPYIGAMLADDVVAAMIAAGRLSDPALATDLTAAITETVQGKWLAMPPQQAAAVSALLRAGRSKPQPRVIPTAAETGQTPAVPVERSVHYDHIVCLEDGREVRMLRKYLRDVYDLSPEEYRHKWSLPKDYPMVAPAYAMQAVRIGDLGGDQ